MKSMMRIIKKQRVKDFKVVTLFFLLLFCANVSANIACEQSEIVSVNIKNESLQKVFKTITDSVGYTFFYETSEIDTNKKINLISNQVCLSELLKRSNPPEPVQSNFYLFQGVI